MIVTTHCMWLRIWNFFLMIAASMVDLNGAQYITGMKISTARQKPITPRFYHHIPKFSKYRAEGELRHCNSTFTLLQYSTNTNDPQRVCQNYFSIVLGLEELMIFIHEIRSSSVPLGEMVFLLRNSVEKDTKFRVDYTEFHPGFNLDISLKKTTNLHENHVVCVNLSCPKLTPEKPDCPPMTMLPVETREKPSYQGSWFKIGISLIIILVLAIIIILVYLIASFYPKMDKIDDENPKNVNHDFSPCNSFDTSEFLRRIDHNQHTLSDTYAKPMSFHTNQNLSDNINTCKSNSSLITIGDGNHEADKQKFVPKIVDHSEMMNDKNRTMPLIKKRYNFDSLRLPSSPEYSLMDQDLSNVSYRTNPSFRSVKYIPPLKLVENEF